MLADLDQSFQAVLSDRVSSVREVSFGNPFLAHGLAFSGHKTKATEIRSVFSGGDLIHDHMFDLVWQSIPAGHVDDWCLMTSDGVTLSAGKVLVELTRHRKNGQELTETWSPYRVDLRKINLALLCGVGKRRWTNNTNKALTFLLFCGSLVQKVRQTSRGKEAKEIQAVVIC
jgi:hypothetical protein